MKAHAWKACKRETVSRVRIPLSPPFSKGLAQLIIYNRMFWASYGRRQMKKFLISSYLLSISIPAFANTKYSRSAEPWPENIVLFIVPLVLFLIWLFGGFDK